MKKNLVKSFLVGASLVVLSGTVLPTLSYASQSPNNYESNIVSNVDVKKYTDDLQPFVRTAKDGTLYLDTTYKDKVKVPDEVTQSITAWMSVVNEDIKQGLATVNSSYEVIYRNSNTSEFSTQVVRGGVDDVRTFWWGFELWLSHSTTTEVIYALTGGATASKVAEIIAKRIPAAPAKVLTLILEFSTVITGGGAALLKIKDQGNGVYLTFGWPIPGSASLPPLSGVEPQY
ncbi:hypothetical protein A9P44_16340 [Paenibacillus polymyxa]|nr:hypothetical protein [Paenibacillus polymyxa]OBA05351.1 hypothetical protein A9P44_16340 [Paenibacillus polymyxa]